MAPGSVIFTLKLLDIWQELAVFGLFSGFLGLFSPFFRVSILFNLNTFLSGKKFKRDREAGAKQLYIPVSL